MVNSKYKDRLFSYIFGREENKEWTLSLYNAVNGSSYDNPDDIEINTIEEFLYMKMKNDLSFILHDYLSLYAHQSTFNPNMPVRELMYVGHIFDKYIKSSSFSLYGERIIPIPVPKLVVFYNGLKDKEDEVILELKDAFPDFIDPNQSDIQVRVRMLNINYGHNRKLMEACKPLMEYSWFVERIRAEKGKGVVLEDAVNIALEQMPKDFLIKDCLVKNKAEVVSMCLTEYDEAEEMEKLKNEYLSEGLEKGMEKGMEKARKEIIADLLESGKITSAIAEELRQKYEVNS